MAPGLSGRWLITGGAGFLARGIYRRAKAEHWDATFTAYSRDDAKHVALQARHPEVLAIRGDVTDEEGLYRAMLGHDGVIHAAAVKYVDLAEMAALDTIRVNVAGSVAAIRASLRARVGYFVGISTDKACEPVNTYGATKLLMERAIQDLGSARLGRYIGVRYGNVVGSTGSVIPKFREQLRTTGVVTVTDPDMTRFWMSVDDAVDTILSAVHEAQPGQIVIPHPRAMRLIDVVHLAVGADAAILTVGIRPGEKAHETLIGHEESFRVHELHLPVQYYALHPPGDNCNPFPFSISSEAAMRMPGAEMLALMEDAKTV